MLLWYDIPCTDTVMFICANMRYHVHMLLLYYSIDDDHAKSTLQSDNKHMLVYTNVQGDTVSNYPPSDDNIAMTPLSNVSSVDFPSGKYVMCVVK